MAMKKLLFFGLALLSPVAAFSWAALDPADLSDGGGSWSGIFLALGVFGAIACHEHEAMVQTHAQVVQSLLKWCFRLAVALGVLTMASRVFGQSLDGVYAMQQLIAFWGIGKAAQGVYISGVATGRKP